MLSDNANPTRCEPKKEQLGDFLSETSTSIDGFAVPVPSLDELGDLGGNYSYNVLILI